MTLLESNDSHNEKKFITLWPDLSLEIQLAIFDNKHHTPSLLRKDSQKLWSAIMASRYPYVRYKAASYARSAILKIPSLIDAIENDTDPLVSCSVYEFRYKNPFAIDGNANQKHWTSSLEDISHFLQFDKEKRQAILINCDLLEISTILKCAIELTSKGDNGGFDNLMSLCDDITWGAEYKYIDNYDYKESRKNASEVIWEIASDLCANKRLAKIGEYISQKLPYPPNIKQLIDLNERALTIALNRSDLVASTERAHLFFETESIEIKRAASSNNLYLSDQDIDRLISSDSDAEKSDLEILSYCDYFSAQHRVAINEALSKICSYDALINDNWERFGDVRLWRMFLTGGEYESFVKDEYELFVVIFCYLLVEAKNKSSAEKQTLTLCYNYQKYDPGLYLPVYLSDFIMFRWTHASRYDRYLINAKRTVSRAAKYVDQNSVWRTYRNIKDMYWRYTSAVILAPNLSNEIFGRSHDMSLDDYPSKTKKTFDSMSVGSSATALSYYSAATLRDLPAYINSRMNMQMNGYVKTLAKILSVFFILIIIFSWVA